MDEAAFATALISAVGMLGMLGREWLRARKAEQLARIQAEAARVLAEKEVANEGYRIQAQAAQRREEREAQALRDERKETGRFQTLAIESKETTIAQLKSWIEELHERLDACEALHDRVLRFVERILLDGEDAVNRAMLREELTELRDSVRPQRRRDSEPKDF